MTFQWKPQATWACLGNSQTSNPSSSFSHWPYINTIFTKTKCKYIYYWPTSVKYWLIHAHPSDKFLLASESLSLTITMCRLWVSQPSIPNSLLFKSLKVKSLCCLCGQGLIEGPWIMDQNTNYIQTVFLLILLFHIINFIPNLPTVHNTISILH